ncbi:hypothetical protein BASA81_009108 [Batrachochytrium salamandrivorans]|nr:hypothetical protein BASA81_009108 [Batrachochytrium salamandrivorans]
MQILVVVVVVLNFAFAPALGLLYRFTGRDFMPAGCFPNVAQYWGGQTDWLPFPARCPIRQDILSGKYSGHADFELDSSEFAQGCSGNVQSLNLDPTAPNLTRYGGGMSCVSTTSNSIGALTKIVEPWLEFHEDGLPKPTYCQLPPKNGRCGWNNPSLASGKPATSGKLLFDKWYRDDATYNKRVSFELNLTETFVGGFEFQSAKFSPLSRFLACGFTADNALNCSNGGKIWPRAQLGSFKDPYDETLPTSNTYGFTTEMHSFFTFAGTETFSFSGDDDVWVYLNQRLALDVGGLHTPAQSIINLASAQVQQKLGLIKGQVYAIDIFHAERKSVGSNFGITTSLQPECGILTSGAAVNSSSEQAWHLVGAAWRSSQLVLQRGEPNLASYAFLKSPQHVGPGFVAKFAFQISQQSSPQANGGFAFVLHRDSLENLNGGSGGNFGFRKNLPHSLAVAFEGFGNRVSLIADGNRTLATAQLMHPNRVDGDGNEHQIEVRFYGQRPNWIEVYLDNGLFLQKRDLELASNVFQGGSSSGVYVGFTSGSGVTDRFDVRVANFQFLAVTVDPKQTSLFNQTSSSAPVTGVANGRDALVLQVQTFDACGNAIQFGGLSKDLVAMLVRADGNATRLLLRRRLGHLEESVIQGQVKDGGNGRYWVEFTTTQMGKYVLFAQFQAVAFVNGTQGVEFLPAVPTPTAAPFGLPLPTENAFPSDLFGILGGALLGICLLFCLLAGWGVRQRNQWRRQKRFIPAGQQAEAERNVEYHNPDAELDDIKVKVERSYHQLNFERSKHVEERALRESLLAQIQELREHIAVLHAKKDQNKLDCT